MSMFPKFVHESIPAAKVAKPAKAEQLHLERLQQEYFALLRRFWQIDTDPAATMDEARRLVVRLDELYRTLCQAGRRVPVRLPLERRNQATTQKGVAL